MKEFIAAAKAISDPTRVRILKMLQLGELCVCHITEVLGLSQSTVSKHLAVLRNAGLVNDRKEGLWVYYRLAETADDCGRSFLRLLREALEDDDTIRQDAERVAGVLCCRE
ncbi:MAG TPA: winged helix-turn-helix transcriptional regulator [Chloroflexi bacterium]|jgi:ArsR family transcriptional regulator|nr:winged helix-turn-helix transcriptional regulator [Chloroflexota bacterium]